MSGILQLQHTAQRKLINWKRLLTILAAVVLAWAAISYPVVAAIIAAVLAIAAIFYLYMQFIDKMFEQYKQDRQARGCTATDEQLWEEFQSEMNRAQWFIQYHTPGAM